MRRSHTFFLLPLLLAVSGGAAAENLWPADGSFETSADLFALPRDDREHFDGKYSLRIDPGRTGRSFRAFRLKEANRPGFLTFYAKADRPCRIEFHSTGDWWNWNGSSSADIDGEWRLCVLPVKPEAERSGLEFCVSSPDREATVWIDAVSFHHDRAPEKYEPRPFEAGVSNPAGNGVIPVSSGPVTHIAAARNNTGGEERLTLTVSLENGSVPGARRLFSKELVLKPGELFEAPVTVLEHAARGYYVIRTVLTRGGEEVACHAQPFAAVDPPPPVGEDAFCGIFFADESRGRNIGATATHQLTHWNDCAPGADGRFRIDAGALTDWNRDGLVHVRSLLLPYDGTELDPETMAEWLCAMDEACGGKVQYWNIGGEVDLAIPNRPERYAEMVNVAAPRLRARNPHVKITGCGVSGVDFNADFLYTAQVLKLAGSQLDAVTVHPYSFNHYVDSTRADIGPEAARTYERAKELQALIAACGSRAEVWYGEVGWAPDVTEDFLSEVNRRAASYIPRLFALSRAAGVRKVFYFLIDLCLERERYNYGIWRANKPLPAVSAYAGAAQALESAVPSAVIANQDYHAFTFLRADGKRLACLWLSNGETAKIHLKLPPGAEVRDMFYNPIEVGEGAWRLSGEMSYLLAEGMTEEAFHRMIADAEVELPPLKAVWRLDGGDALILTLHNLKTVPQKGSVSLSGASFVKAVRSVELPPAGSRSFRFRAGEFLNGRTVRLTVRTDAGEIQEEYRPSILNCPRWSVAEFKGDALPDRGRLPDLDSRNWLLPNDPGNGWDGPQNLSVKSAVGYDDRFLYCRIDVRDDVHCQNGVPGRLWALDCVQLAVDSKGNAKPGSGYDADDYEFGFALSSGRPEKELTYTADTGRFRKILESLECDVQRVGDTTRYRIAVPWHTLKITPERGTVFGMNFTANDSDGAALRYWMGLTPGICDGKNPGVFRKFVLE